MFTWLYSGIQGRHSKYSITIHCSLTNMPCYPHTLLLLTPHPTQEKAARNEKQGLCRSPSRSHSLSVPSIFVSFSSHRAKIYILTHRSPVQIQVRTTSKAGPAFPIHLNVDIPRKRCRGNLRSGPGCPASAQAGC